MTRNTRAYLHILTLPFVVSAAVEFLPAWVYWPIALLGGMGMVWCLCNFERKHMKDEAFDDIEKAQQRIESKKDAALRLAREALQIPWNEPYVDGCDLALGMRVKAIKAIDEAL